MLCAIYKRLSECRPSKASEEREDEWKSIRSSVYKKIISEKTTTPGQFEEPLDRDGRRYFFARVLPSLQGQNRADYRAVLTECGAVKNQDKPPYWGNRRICRAFYHFYAQLLPNFDALSDMVERVNNMSFIHISVPSQADAYRLFEALNNRGEPLSALDIIKNSILAKVEREGGSIDESFELWKDMTDRLTDDEAVQERYLRHFYHAFRHRKEICVQAHPRATKSTVIKIYAELKKRNAQTLLKALSDKSKLYQCVISPDEVKQSAHRIALLNDLLRIGAAPAQQVLLYLLDCEEGGHLESDRTFDQISSFLAKYFVRRNITDQPPTNRLDPIFASVFEAAQKEISKTRGLSASWFANVMMTSKANPPADDEQFERVLSDNLFYNNASMARYVLCRINKSFKNREYDPNIWRRNERGGFAWTVEHILPQADKLRPEWIEMIAQGDADKAYEVRESVLHCLGNLTLSAYNSRLSDRAFITKKDKTEISVDGEKLNIGYRNRLPINELEFEVDGKLISLASARRWSQAEIEARNKAIVARCMKLFKLSSQP